MELKDKVVVRDMLGNNINGVIIGIDNTKDIDLKYMVALDTPMIIKDSDNTNRATIPMNNMVIDFMNVETVPRLSSYGKYFVWVEETQVQKIGDCPQKHSPLRACYMMGDIVMLDTYNKDGDMDIDEAYGYIIGVDMEECPQLLIGFNRRFVNEYIKVDYIDGDCMVQPLERGIEDNDACVYATNVKDFISYVWVNPGDIREKVQI